MLSKVINDMINLILTRSSLSDYVLIHTNFRNYQLETLRLEPTLMAFGVKGSGLAQALPEIKLPEDVEVGDDLCR